MCLLLVNRLPYFSKTEGSGLCLLLPGHLPLQLLDKIGWSLLFLVRPGTSLILCYYLHLPTQPPASAAFATPGTQHNPSLALFSKVLQRFAVWQLSLKVWGQRRGSVD